MRDRFGVDLREYFAAELDALGGPDGPVADGFLEIGARGAPRHARAAGSSSATSAWPSTGTWARTRDGRSFPAPFENPMTDHVTEPTAVLLFNLGGPDDLASVEPFLVNLFSDREIIELPFGAALQPVIARVIAKLRGPSVRRNYARIGGGSPQLR